MAMTISAAYAMSPFEENRNEEIAYTVIVYPDGTTVKYPGNLTEEQIAELYRIWEQTHKSKG